MNNTMKMMMVAMAISAVGMLAGCGGGGGGGSDWSAASAGGSAAGAPSSAPPAGVSTESAVLYAANCEGCHGPLATSEKLGITLARLQNAIAGNIGGMGSLSALTVAEQQLIVSGLNPAATPPPTTTVDGAALYAANCAGCHGALANSGKKGITLARLQGAITGNVGNMGFLSTLTAAQQQAVVTALAVTTTPPVTTVDGAALYASNCASCHGTLANSGKKNITLARLQGAITGNVGNMGFLSTLNAAQQQAIVTALVSTTPPPPVTTVDGAALYAGSCASCHGPLATSAKAGATATRIQTAITNNVGNMGGLSTLSTAQVAAIATSLATVTPSVTPPAACGSCHAIPPATGMHAFHAGRNVACATCHGAGYSTTTVNATTHNNGVKNLTTTIGWTASTRSCSNSCHGRKSW
jgi:mono/diheme cytochrome c family protein